MTVDDINYIMKGRKSSTEVLDLTNLKKKLVSKERKPMRRKWTCSIRTKNAMKENNQVSLAIGKEATSTNK